MTGLEAIQDPGRCTAVHRHELNAGMPLKEGHQIIGNNGLGIDRGIEAPRALRRLARVPESYAVLE